MAAVILPVVGLLATIPSVNVTGQATLDPAGAALSIKVGEAVCSGPVAGGLTYLACSDGRQAILRVRIRGSHGEASGTLGDTGLRLNIGSGAQAPPAAPQNANTFPGGRQPF